MFCLAINIFVNLCVGWNNENNIEKKKTRMVSILKALPWNIHQQFGWSNELRGGGASVVGKIYIQPRTEMRSSHNHILFISKKKFKNK